MAVSAFGKLNVWPSQILPLVLVICTTGTKVILIISEPEQLPTVSVNLNSYTPNADAVIVGSSIVLLLKLTVPGPVIFSHNSDDEPSERVPFTVYTNEHILSSAKPASGDGISLMVIVKLSVTATLLHAPLPYAVIVKVTVCPGKSKSSACGVYVGVAVVSPVIEPLPLCVQMYDDVLSLSITVPVTLYVSLTQITPLSPASTVGFNVTATVTTEPYLTVQPFASLTYKS